MEHKHHLITAKYHLSIVDRLFTSYAQLGHKRFLVGIISELAKASSHLIQAFVSLNGASSSSRSQTLRAFSDHIAPKHLSKEDLSNILKSLEIEKAQALSPIQYTKENVMILLIHGTYRFVTAERLRELERSVEIGIKLCSDICRQV